MEAPASTDSDGRVARSERAFTRGFGFLEFVALLALGMAGWFLCSPVLPIPADRHVRAVTIALAEMLFLVGFGCLAARRPGFVPSTARRFLGRAETAIGMTHLFIFVFAAAAVSILGTRIVQAVVVKILWSPALASAAPAAVRDAGRKTFEIFKAHPIAVGVGFPIIEEIHFRLFLMTVIAWAIGRVTRSTAGDLGGPSGGRLS